MKPNKVDTVVHGCNAWLSLWTLSCRCLVNPFYVVSALHHCFLVSLLSFSGQRYKNKEEEPVPVDDVDKCSCKCTETSVLVSLLQRNESIRTHHHKRHTKFEPVNVQTTQY